MQALSEREHEVRRELQEVSGYAFCMGCSCCYDIFYFATDENAQEAMNLMKSLTSEDDTLVLYDDIGLAHTNLRAYSHFRKKEGYLTNPSHEFIQELTEDIERGLKSLEKEAVQS